MPAPSATPAATRHQWHMRFDAVTCRNCDAPMRYLEDVERPCPGANRIRPIAGLRQQFKPDFSRHPKLKKAWDRWQADRGRA
ncbi:MAG: hypothetical protein JWQ83_1141 [Lacunisphaera sp.]|nr:hypothetical protein [Lacunisphaera sp.]